MERKDPESLKQVNAIKVTGEIKDFVSNLANAVVEAKTARGAWETKIDQYINMRFGIRANKVKPWPGCANYMMPLIDTDIARVKPSYVNLVNVSPIVSFEAYGPEDIEPARKREWLFDWVMRTKMDYFLPYVTGVDYALSQGATMFKVTWKYSTRSYYKNIDLKELPEDVLNAIYDPRMDDEYLYKILVEEFLIDDTFEENVEEIYKGIKKFREGKSEIELKLLEAADDQPDMTPCSIRHDVVFPIDTEDIDDARFIDYIFTRSQNDLKIAMKDGRYEKYLDDEIATWTATAPQDKRRVNPTRGASQNKKDELVWLHETCVWYDIDNDGIEERCIVTWPDAHPECILRFIELPYDHGQWPYSLIKREIIGTGAFESRGYGALGEDFQNAITAFVNQSVDNGTITNTPLVKHKRNSLTNIKNLRYIPGEPVEVQGNMTDVEIGAIGNTSQGFLFQSAQYFKAWADQRTGNLSAGLTSPNNQPGSGQQGNKTAKEVNLVEGLQSQVQSLDLQVWQQQMARVYYQINALIDQYMSDEEIQIITNERPVKISRRETQGKYNIVPNGKLDNSNPALRAAKAFRLMQVFINDPMINQRELKELFLTENDVRLARVLLKSPEQIAQEQRQMMMAQAQAKQEAINTQLNLRVASDQLDIAKATALVPVEGAKYKED